MIGIAEAQNTSGDVLGAVFGRLVQVEARPDILSAAILMTQAWLDVPELGWSVFVTADGNADLAGKLADELAQMCWDCRAQMTVEFASGPESVNRALACRGRPVVIADGADATNSGAGGDSVHLLKEMMGRQIPGRALSIMVDPLAVAHAESVGRGGTFEFGVGGKRDNRFSRPLNVKGQVQSLQHAKYVLTGHGGDNLNVDMGLSAIVNVGDVTLLLVTQAGPGSTPLMYRCVGLEPRDFKIVVVKSPAGFRAEFEPFAAEVILADCPGCASPHLETLPYKHIDRPLWPLDDIDDWREVAWANKQINL